MSFIPVIKVQRETFEEIILPFLNKMYLMIIPHLCRVQFHFETEPQKTFFHFLFNEKPQTFHNKHLFVTFLELKKNKQRSKHRRERGNSKAIRLLPTTFESFFICIVLLNCTRYVIGIYSTLSHKSTTNRFLKRQHQSSFFYQAILNALKYP